MPDLFCYLLAFVLALSPLVFIHELGHYLMARYFGVKVECFSIGFGPSLISWLDKNETRWKISLFLFGGYVKMAGDENAASSYGTSIREDSLHAQSPWKKMLIGAAGPFANYLFAFVLLTGLMIKCGMPFAHNDISSVQPGSVAEKYGLTVGDTLEQINGQPTESFQEIQKYLLSNKPLDITLSKNSAQRTIHIPKEELSQTIGMIPRESYCPATLTQALNRTLSMMNPIKTLKNLKPKNMGGPITIAHQSGRVFKQGWLKFLFFMGMISIALGFFNLLPIPLLDGGLILFAFIEMIRKKPLSEKTQEQISNIFGTLLIGMFLYFSWNDLRQLGLFKRFF